jgi:hypothetical protein
VAHFDRAIPPGGEGKVTLTLNLKDFQGPVWKTATIVSNDPLRPFLTLDLHGQVRPPIEIRPAPFVQFTGTKEGEQEKEVDLLTTFQSFKILRVENLLGEKIAYSIETIAKERHYRLKIINRQTKASYSGMIKCYTNHPQKPEIPILIRFVVNG